MCNAWERLSWIKLRPFSVVMEPNVFSNSYCIGVTYCWIGAKLGWLDAVKALYNIFGVKCLVVGCVMVRLGVIARAYFSIRNW